jgi:D-sedoheptulose 7-phosphate isomerase
MFNELLERYPALDCCKEEIKKAAEAIIACYENGGKVMLCGNGGSCADCEHIVGELMKGFLLRRPVSEEQKNEMKKNFEGINDEMLGKLQCGLPAISLPHVSALNSAFCNDVDPALIYAQSLFGLGRKGDILIGLSTSGNAKNVNAAAEVARALGITVIGMTGAKGGKLYENADICIRVPENETFKIQELHLPVYHYLCAAVEEHFFKE